MMDGEVEEWELDVRTEAGEQEAFEAVVAYFFHNAFEETFVKPVQ